MTDRPGPGPEERLPAPRPPAEPAPVERFSSPPSARAFDLTPERAAKIVRQSSNARWIGFLATAIVALFVIGYYFYELGLPAGLSESRLLGEEDAQQVRAVERGYYLYNANCATCHGPDGEGGVGPPLNDQNKLLSHLDEDYIRNVLRVGGRYVCGDPNSQMPVWSNENGGPLNYQQIEEIIAFIRAPNDHEYDVRKAETFERTGETFQGWRDPNYKPPPEATPVPACWTRPETSGAPSPGASAAPTGGPVSSTLQVSAAAVKFNTAQLTAPAGEELTIEFDNQDAGIQHNVAIHEGSPTGPQVFQGEIFPGPGQRTYSVPALDAGAYGFICTVHPTTMTGTLTVQ
jgi:mono/diheme cytochrome c family protein/plastocyanin